MSCASSTTFSGQSHFSGAFTSDFEGSIPASFVFPAEPCCWFGWNCKPFASNVHIAAPFFDLVHTYCRIDLFKQHHTTSIKISVAAMVIGSLIAAFDDLAFDLVGYTYATVNNLATVGNGIATKIKLEAKDLTSQDSFL